MIQPPFLKQGDAVCIVAPGKKLDEENIHVSVSMLKAWGLNVRLGKNLFSSGHSYLSGTDAERLEDLQQALNDSTVNAILCARGGYGTTRILDQLDYSAFIKNPKWICGFSDITALHLRLQSLGIQSIHSTMPVLFPKKESAASVESLRNLLFEKPEPLSAATFAGNKAGDCSGELTGGNLSLIVDSLGTTSEIKTENRILIIEEIDEQYYRLDRMLVQLKRAGKLKNLAGMIVGHMTNLSDGQSPFGEPVQQIIANHVSTYNYPLAFNFLVGHENPNLAWIYGAIGKLSVTNQKSILSY